MNRTIITPELVKVAAPGCRDPHAAAAALDGIARLRGIHSRRAVAMLLAQLGHESELNPITENLSYSAIRMTQVWPARFPTVASAKPYEFAPRELANRVYNGRMGNRPGSNDGWNYRGRGYIQITGRDMYAALGYEGSPDMLLGHIASADAAVKFLKRKNVDLDQDSIERVTLRINGGHNGLPDRRARFERLMRAIPDNRLIDLPEPDRILLVPLGGGDPTPWNGESAVYGGLDLNDALVAELDRAYPSAGGPWTHLHPGARIRVWRRANGVFVLERL